MEAERNPRLVAYLAGRGVDRVPGWLNPGAAYTTFLLSEWQHRRGVVGDVGEIGVHHGKYFILLALLRGPGERAVAVDVFGDQHLNPDRSGQGDREKFLANCAAHIGSLDGLVVHQCDSLALAGRDLVVAGLPAAPVPRRSFRIFSVDGSHTARHTASDVETAFASLAPGGVVVVDDFYNARWPGVQEGVHRVLAARPDISAPAYGDNKLFLVRTEDYPAFLDFFAGEIADLHTDAKPVELHGRPALYFSLKEAAAAFDPGLERKRRLLSTFGQGGEGVVQLLSGWAPHREPNGTWVTEPRAEALVTVPRGLHALVRGDARLSVTVTPFVHPARQSRHLTVTTSFGAGFSGTLEGTARIELPLPKAALAKPIHLMFEGEAPERPFGLIEGNTDTRTLSFKVKEMELDLDPGG